MASPVPSSENRVEDDLERALAPLLGGGQVTGRPGLQIAPDGEWERAERFTLPAEKTAVMRTARKHARGAEAHVAIEILWPGPPIVFVGTKFLSARDDLHALEQTLSRVLAGAHLAPVTALNALRGARSGRLARIDIGVINAWLSCRPLCLWEFGLDSDRDVIEVLSTRPDLELSSRPVALEVVRADQNGVGWCGIEVSTQVESSHMVDPNRVKQLVAALVAASD